MTTLTIQKKIMLMTGALLLTLLTMGGLSFYQTHTLNKDIHQLGEVDLVALKNMSDTDMMHDGIRAVVFRAFLAKDMNDEVSFNEARQEMADFSENIKGYMKTLNDLPLANDVHEAIVKSQPSLEAYVADANRLVNDLADGKFIDKEQSFKSFGVSFEALEHDLGAVGELIENNGKASVEYAYTEGANFKLLSIGISLFSLIFGSGLFLYIMKSIKGPIGVLNNMASTMTSSSDAMVGVSAQLSAASEETATQASVVSAAAEQVSKNVQTVATNVEQLNLSIREISKNTTDAAQVAAEAVEAAQSTNQCISKLGESSVEIGNVLKVITSIAEQTNLLALNATIEAARAGEAGKGFAVVANEVKELAKQTAKATEDIGHRIETIQGDTGEAVKAIEHISSVISKIHDIQNTVASAVEEQSATSTEITRNIEETAKGSSEIAQNITGVAQAAQSTTIGATETSNSAGEMSRMAEELKKSVALF